MGALNGPMLAADLVLQLPIHCLAGFAAILSLLATSAV